MAMKTTEDAKGILFKHKHVNKKSRVNNPEIPMHLRGKILPSSKEASAQRQLLAAQCPSQMGQKGHA